MARKITNTKSPKARQRSGNLPEFRAELDLCKISTARIRALSPAQLKKAQERLGPIHMLPKKEHGRNSFRWLLSIFTSNLRQVKTTPLTRHDVEYDMKRRTGWNPETGDKGYREVTEKEIQEKLAHNIKIHRSTTQILNDDERKIWEMQERAGCKLRGEEIVARDAEREGKHETAAEIRKSARRPPTPHRRPAKIR